MLVPGGHLVILELSLIHIYIRKEYEILLNELRTFNPEMLDKQRVLAVTKCDICLLYTSRCV